MKIMPICTANSNSMNKQQKSQPAFGKLIISKEAQDALAQCNFDGLSRLRLAAKRLEQTSNWDLKVLSLHPSNDALGGSYQVQNRAGNKAYRSVFQPTTYASDSEIIESPKFYVRTIDANTGELKNVNLNFRSVKDAERAYHIMDGEKNLERATGMTLHLEAESEGGFNGASYKKAFLANVEQARKYMINKLIEKCGE